MKTVSVYKNIIANYAGTFATTIVAFLLIPVYIRYLGVGAYGIIGFYVSIQALLAFLDMGIGITLNREMARNYHDREQIGYLRTLSHSLQVVYWCIGLGIGLILFLAAPYLAKGWFRETTVPVQTIGYVFMILAITLIMRWPYGLYTSGIRGMQRQVSLNIYEIFWNLTKSIGSWLVLKYISPTLAAFLWYQCIVSFLQTTGIVILFWNYLGSTKSPLNFDFGILKKVGRFAVGMGAGSIIASVVAQMDKIVVSKVVSDTEFGFYNIANNIAMLVFSISLPIYMALFPHFTKQVQDGNRAKLSAEFHYYSRLLSSLLLPFGIIIIIHAKTVLSLWLKDEWLATHSAPILQWLMAGTVFNALMMPVHTLLLAHSRIRFMLISQVIELTCMFPLLLFLISKFGVIGGATGVFILFFGYFLIQAPLIFKTTHFTPMALNWYLKDILIFLIPLAAISFFAEKFIFPYFAESRFRIILYLVFVFVISYTFSIFSNRLLFNAIIRKFTFMVKKR